jgi:hypothetical protein
MGRRAKAKESVAGYMDEMQVTAAEMIEYLTKRAR